MRKAKKTIFTFADLCAGIGGFRLGLESIGGQCLYSCEIDKDCERTYNSNFSSNFDHSDINTINENDFPYVDILCAGFPCQPFSIAGKQKGFEDPRGNIVFKISSIAKASKPKIIFLENVSNLLKMDSGKAFQLIKNSIENAGYTLFSDILDSSNFGIPQTRPRIYLVAIRRDLSSSNFSFTKKRTGKVPYRKFICHGDNTIPISEKWNEYIDLYTGKKPSSKIPFKIPKTRVKLERQDSDAILTNCIFQIRSSGIRALSIDKPLPTFAVSISGGGAMIPVYSKERRHISLTEMKRLMGFPDSFVLPVSRTNAIKQLANAVCPPVIKSIGEDILSFLLRISN